MAHRCSDNRGPTVYIYIYIYIMPILGGLFKWSEIASKMASGRTDSMCSRRWAQLNEANEVTEYFAKAMKKNALMMPHLSQRGRRRSKTKITVEVSNDCN